MVRVIRATVVSVLALVLTVPVVGQDATPSPPTTPTPVLAGSWSAIPDAPWGTVFSATAFTGSEVLVVDLPTGRTLGYDPASGVWTRHARAPQRFDDLSPSVWTGTELLVFDREKPTRNYAYDPEADTWRQLAGSPLREQWVATWADGQAVVGDRKKGVAAYDLATDTWRALPDVPGGRILDSLDWTGDVVLAVTSGNERSGVQVATLDLASNRWGTPDKGPVNGLDSGADWVGDRLLFARGGGPRADAAFDPLTGDWTAIEDYDCPVATGTALWTGSLLVSAYGEHAYDPATDTCYNLPDPEVWAAFNDDDTRAWATSLWTGEELVWWSGAYGDSEIIYTDGISFRPTPASDASGPRQAEDAVTAEASSAFERLWRPLDAEDIPFDYSCASDMTFTTSDLAAASPTSDAGGSLAALIEEVGPQISDGDTDWYVVQQTDDRALALAPKGRTADVQLLERTDEGWDFETGGSTCTPRAWFGERGVGRWRLDPAFPAPGPKTRQLHVLGYLGCLGTERAGKARIHLTKDAALVAIPMRSTVGPLFGACLGPTKMTVTLPKPLGRRTLYDAGSLPLRGANEKLDIDRINSSGSGG